MRRPGFGRWAAVLVAGGLLATLPAPAQAETPRVQVASGTDATIRNGPAAVGSGYVIGNALTDRFGHHGVTFDEVPTADHNGFRYGMIHGNFRFCAWLSKDATTRDHGHTAAPHCPGGASGRTLPVQKFMFRAPDGRPLRNCEPGTCGDGSPVAVQPARCAAQYPGGVPVYGNVLPWRPTSAPHDRYATITAPSYKVLWRYVSRDGTWVMVRDGHPDGSAARQNAGFHAEDSNWFFVPRACVTDQDGRLH